MAKKASVGAKYVVIDLPVGPDVKINSKAKAEAMAERFVAVGKNLGMHVEVVLTDGTEPSGKAFGPALEAKYVLEILEGKFFDNLAQKSCELAGVILEIVGKAKKGEGYGMAKKTLEEGKALQKMKEIIAAQGKRVDKSTDIKPAPFIKKFYSKESGEISKINVRKCIKVARIAGCPSDKRAGLLLHVEKGDKIKAGQIIFEIHAENERKLQLAEKFVNENKLIELGRVIIEKIS